MYEQDRPTDKETDLVPSSQAFYSHHDRQHKPDKRPTKHPDAVAGKLQLELSIWVSQLPSPPRGCSWCLAQTPGQTERGWAPSNKLITTVNKKVESQVYNEKREPANVVSNA